jgi:hypothetical protein
MLISGINSIIKEEPTVKMGVKTSLVCLVLLVSLSLCSTTFAADLDNTSIEASATIPLYSQIRGLSNMVDMGTVLWTNGVYKMLEKNIWFTLVANGDVMVTVTPTDVFRLDGESDDYYLGALVNLMEGHKVIAGRADKKHPHSTPTSKSTVIAGPVEKELRLQLLATPNGDKDIHELREGVYRGTFAVTVSAPVE